jgi:tripartite-type tricarboxylate transporter receptor subunit TctC
VRRHLQGAAADMGGHRGATAAAPPGGGHDIAARLIGQWLSGRLAQSFIIDNRPGANTNIGAQAAANAIPDGYTLLLLGSAHTVNVGFYGKLAVDLTRDIVPVAALSSTSMAMLIHPSVPTKTIPEFIAYAKANPGKLNMASGGNGSPEHLAGELFKMMTGVSNAPRISALPLAARQPLHRLPAFT